MDCVNKKILCKKHPQFTCQMISTDQNNSSLLLCVNCLQVNAKISSVIRIEEILQCKQDQILNNWPPHEDSNFKKLMDKLQQDISLSPRTPEDVEAYFSYLEEEIIEILRKKKKQTLIQIQSPSPPIEIYRKIAQINKLKDIFLNCEDYYSVNKALKKEIAIHHSKSEQNFKEMKEIISSQNVINFEEMDAWKHNLLELINSYRKQQVTQNLIDTINIVASPYNQESKGQLIIKKKTTDLKNEAISFINVDDDIQYAHIDQSLLNHLKYKINIEIKSNSYSSQKIGLLLLEDLSQDWREKQEIIQFVNRGYQQSMQEVMIGEDIWDQSYYNKNKLQDRGKTTKVELRICIKDQIFQAFEYPNYQNGISLNAFHFNDNLQYYLAFFHCNKNDRLTLEDFSIVDCF